MLETLHKWDLQLFHLIHNEMTHSWADSFFVWVTDLHKTPYFAAIIIPFVIFLFVRFYRLNGVYLFLLLLVAIGINDFTGGRLKRYFDRDRPFQNEIVESLQKSPAGGRSFPSNHASNMFTFATYTAQFIPGAKIPLYLIAGTVSYSRVYNGVHYPSDVFVGSILGYIWGLLFSKLGKKLLSYLQKRKTARKTSE